jgi:vacuolar-type H+-ATPase subunit I/STV1
MPEIDNLQSQLAQEERTLKATQGQIQAAHGNIEALRAQIEDTQQKITATENHIEKLKEQISTIEKRIALLREYMDMVEAGGVTIEPLEPIEPQVTEDEDIDIEGVDLEFVQPLMAPDGVDSSVEEDEGPTTLHNVDEEYFTDEILPRTKTFGEELLLVLAHHRKAVAPKGIAGLFRRLDYAPKLSPTSKNVKTQVETDAHLYEITKDKVALTREGRTEAQNLLQQLL